MSEDSEPPPPPPTSPPPRSNARMVFSTEKTIPNSIADTAAAQVAKEVRRKHVANSAVGKKMKSHKIGINRDERRISLEEKARFL